MPIQPIRLLLLCAASLCLVPGCKNEEACVKARNAASDSWKAVTESASRNRLAPSIAIDELPADKKGAHVEAWGTIAKQSEMISSSFAYEKITWNTANPAQQKANAAFDGYFAKEHFKSFETQLRDANDKFKATAQVCGE